MRNTKYFLLGIIFLIITILNFACKKDVSSGYNAPSFAKDTISLPQLLLNKADSNYVHLNDTLYQLVTFVGYANTVPEHLNSVLNIDPSNQTDYKMTNSTDGSKLFSYTTSSGENISLSYYNTSSESWWKFFEDSASYSQEVYYIDNKGSSGEIDVYKFTNYKSPKGLIYREVWSSSGTNTTDTINSYNSNGSINEQFVSVTSSTSSKNGNFSAYVPGYNGTVVKQWYFSWNVAGQGTYIYYMPDGTIYNQGRF